MTSGGRSAGGETPGFDQRAHLECAGSSLTDRPDSEACQRPLRIIASLSGTPVSGEQPTGEDAGQGGRVRVDARGCAVGPGGIRQAGVVSAGTSRPEESGGPLYHRVAGWRGHPVRRSGAGGAVPSILPWLGVARRWDRPAGHARSAGSGAVRRADGPGGDEIGLPRRPEPPDRPDEAGGGHEHHGQRR